MAGPIPWHTVDDLANEIVNAREQGPRSAEYRQTFLNRSPRTLRKIRRATTALALRHGLNPEQLWNDVKDMAELELFAE